jgi:hypothetical protein
MPPRKSGRAPARPDDGRTPGEADHIPAHVGRIYECICAHPGITVPAIARCTGLSYEIIRGALPTLDAYGLLIYETLTGGHLYPFE